MSGLVNVTVAPGTLCPAASRIRLLIMPLELCAAASELHPHEDGEDFGRPMIAVPHSPSFSVEIAGITQPVRYINAVLPPHRVVPSGQLAAVSALRRRTENEGGCHARHGRSHGSRGSRILKDIEQIRKSSIGTPNCRLSAQLL